MIYQVMLIIMIKKNFICLNRLIQVDMKVFQKLSKIENKFYRNI